MIQEYVVNLAAQMEIPLSKISVVKGRDVGSFSVHLLNLSTDNHLVSALVNQSEMEALQNDSNCERLELKIRDALSRLQLKLES